MDDRLRIPHDSDYLAALGFAVFAFARTEWDAAWCCERLCPSYLDKIESQKKTAGRIAADMEELFARVSDTTLRSRLSSLAADFRNLTEDRNSLLHAKPGSAIDGAQRLFEPGGVWTPERINDFADNCVRVGQPLNSLLYDELRDGHELTLMGI